TIQEKGSVFEALRLRQRAPQDEGRGVPRIAKELGLGGYLQGRIPRELASLDASSERSILEVSGRSLVARMRAQDQRESCCNQQVDDHGRQAIVSGEAEIDIADERHVPL